MCILSLFLFHRMTALVPSILNSIPHFSIPEIATIFTGYTESHVFIPKLSKALIKSFSSRSSEISPKNALSLLYSFSRSFKKQSQSQLQSQNSYRNKVEVNYRFDRSVIDGLNKVIISHIEEYVNEP